MTIESFISRLDGVKETGQGKYVARCPAHDDKSPSLSIKECGDGRILIHDFAGCETEDVLAAVGMTFSDIMPERLTSRVGNEHCYKPMRQPFDARQVLATLDHESLVVAIIGTDVLEHKELDNETCDRLGVAVNRINAARAECAPLRHRP